MRSLDEIWCELERISNIISREHCECNGCDGCPFDDGSECVVNRLATLKGNVSEFENAIAKLMVGKYES